MTTQGFGRSATSVVGDAVFAIDFWGVLSRSLDRAGSWMEIPSPSEGARVLSMVSDGEVLFAAVQHDAPFDGGIYTTQDLGETWNRLESAQGPFTSSAMSLTLDGDILYISTIGTGLWAAHLGSPLR